MLSPLYCASPSPFSATSRWRRFWRTDSAARQRVTRSDGSLPTSSERFEPIDLPALIGGTVDFFMLAAREKGLSLDASIEPGCPTQLNGDGLRLKQILNNLLSNAVKFTATGSIHLRVQCQPGQLVIHVDDTGPGIPSELHEVIFEKFRQANARISHDHGGTGLGLALSRGLASLMNGSLTVQSEPGRGSRFTLTLPIAAPPAVDTPPEAIVRDAAEPGRVSIA